MTQEGTVLAAARRLLAERAAAVRAGTRSGYAGADEVELMAAVGLSPVTYEDVRSSGAPPASAGSPGEPGGVAQVAATLRYRVAGHDRADRTSRRLVTLHRTSAGWRISGEAPAPGAPSLPWDVDGAVVAEGERSLVVGALDRAGATAYTRLADAAVGAVDAAWQRPWSRRLLVVVAADAAGVRAQVGGSADLDQLAAVTDGPVGADGLATGDRVVLDRAAMDGLTAVGREFVVRHETVHVALRSSLAGRAPRWVTEGFADHVGYSGTGLDQVQVAAGLLDQVAAGSGPEALPDDGDFDPAGGDIAPAYAAAWIAVEQVARAVGPSGLRRFVVAATSAGSAESAQAATAGAFEEVLGTTEEAFTRAWRQRPAELASAR
ncbi:MAG TPA: hypothetical protein VES95_01975 [Dermatophilaceae bacterium]|nr:hypothetical protein [Dermatophilaceae bacterium]